MDDLAEVTLPRFHTLFDPTLVIPFIITLGLHGAALLVAGGPLRRQGASPWKILVIQLRLADDRSPMIAMADELRRWLPVTRIVACGEGDFCAAYLVDDRVVVRVAKHDAASAALRREFALLPELARSIDVAIPCPLFGGTTTTGFAVMGHELVRGEALDAERLPALVSDRRTALAGELRRFVEQMHAFDTSRAIDLGVPRYDARAKLVRHRAEIEARVWPRLSAAARDGCRAARLQLERAPDPRRVLAHNDLSPGHVLVDDTGRLTGVIDFGDVAITEPDYDLRFLYEDFGAPFLSAVLDGDPPTMAKARFERARAFSIWDSLVWILTRLDGNAAEVDNALAQIEEQATAG